MAPLSSTSRSSLGRTLDGGDCNDAGPAKALPVLASYMLPWQGHSPLFLPSSGQNRHRHHRCKQTMLYALNAETSSFSPPYSGGSLMNCHLLKGSSSRTLSPVDGYRIACEELIGNVLTFACVPSGSVTGALCKLPPIGLGMNLPQSINGVNVITVPAAAMSFRKSRLETLPPFSEGCWDMI